MTDIYDITIVGAGPIGLFAAFYAGMRGAKTKIIDSLPQVGGQLATLYPEKHIYDAPGFPAVRAIDLIENLDAQLEKFDHTFCLEEEVTAIDESEDFLTITTDKGRHYSKSIILALGNGSFQPRKINLPNAEELENQGLDYFVNDLAKYKGQRVAIAGGGDSAIDWALMLEPIAKEVSLIHRRPEFRGHEHSVAQLHQSSVNILTPYVIDTLNATNQQLDSIRLQKVRSEEFLELPVDTLIVNYGFSSSLEHLKAWGLETKRNAILVNSDMSTNIPGVYAAGDIVHYHGKVKLIATGLGEAPTAVNNALHYINPKNRTQPMHSTSLFEKK